MGKYNKKYEPKQDLFKRFCPKCGRQSYYFQCLTDATPTHKINMTRNIGQIVANDEMKK